MRHDKQQLITKFSKRHFRFKNAVSGLDIILFGSEDAKISNINLVCYAYADLETFQILKIT